jgi:hypothetical protein
VEAGEARAVTAENLAHLKPYLECAAVPKIACDVKARCSTWRAWASRAAASTRHHALRLPARCRPRRRSLEEQASRRLDLKLGASPEQHADIVLELITAARPAIDERGLRKLYAEIELPLAGVLARMERTGVRIDRNELQRLSTMMETEIARLTADIHGWPGGRSTSARRSNSATCCSTI